MSLQRRPITGMGSTTTNTPPIVVPAVATVLHQVDASTLNTIDQVTIDVTNTNVAARSLDLVILGVPVSMLVQPGTTRRVLDAQPFFGLPNSAPAVTQITGALGAGGQQGDLLVWGFFTR